jgi:hypothetical protein
MLKWPERPVREQEHVGPLGARGLRRAPVVALRVCLVAVSVGRRLFSRGVLI